MPESNGRAQGSDRGWLRWRCGGESCTVLSSACTPPRASTSDLQPTPQQPQPPNQLLEELRDILLHTFRTEFDAAAEKKDEQAVSRFFRLWPGIGAEREGLEAYGDFVVSLVKARNANTGKRKSTWTHLTERYS